MNESFLMQFEEFMLEFVSFITKVCFLNGRTSLGGKKTPKIDHTRQTRALSIYKQESAVGNISLLIFSWMHIESYPKITGQYKSGREFRKPLIQTPAQSWTSWSLSSLILKTSRDTESTNFLGTLFHCSAVFMISHFFLFVLSSLKISLKPLILCPLPPSLPLCTTVHTTVKTWLFKNFPPGPNGGFQELSLLQVGQGQFCQPLLTRKNPAACKYLGGPLLTSFQFIRIFLVVRIPTFNAISTSNDLWSNEC